MNSQSKSLVDWVADDLAQNQSVQQAAQELGPIILELSTMFARACAWVQKTIQEAHESHLRRERLAAYQSRHRWKLSDVRPLLSIGVNDCANQRIAKLKGRGQPVVQVHRPLGEAFVERVAVISYMFREDATPEQRRRSFRAWPWWKHHVEAYYRGEYGQAKLNGTTAPYEHAEQLVGCALGMSQASVHAVCGEIRAMRKRDSDYADFPARTLEHYKTWMRDGWACAHINDKDSTI